MPNATTKWSTWMWIKPNTKEVKENFNKGNFSSFCRGPIMVGMLAAHGCTTSHSLQLRNESVISCFSFWFSTFHHLVEPELDSFAWVSAIG